MTKLVWIALLLLTACASPKGPEYIGSESNLRERARIHTELGAGYFGQNQMEIALEEFTEAARIDPTYGLAYNGLGLVYANLREDVKADNNFQKSLKLEPRNSESRNNYGTFLCSRNRIDESITQFLEAVKNPLYATPALAYLNAGLCSLRKNDVKNAELYLQKALQADPLLNQAAYQLALIQFNRSNFPQAHLYLQNALVSVPSAETLWLAIRIERKLGSRDAEASYALQLRSKYPNSEQTKALLAGQ